MYLIYLNERSRGIKLLINSFANVKVFSYRFRKYSRRCLFFSLLKFFPPLWMEFRYTTLPHVMSIRNKYDPRKHAKGKVLRVSQEPIDVYERPKVSGARVNVKVESCQLFRILPELVQTDPSPVETPASYTKLHLERLLGNKTHGLFFIPTSRGKRTIQYSKFKISS